MQVGPASDPGASVGSLWKACNPFLDLTNPRKDEHCLAPGFPSWVVLLLLIKLADLYLYNYTGTLPVSLINTS